MRAPEDPIDVHDVDWAEHAYDQINGRADTGAHYQPYARAAVYALLDIGNQLRRIADALGQDR